MKVNVRITVDGELKVDREGDVSKTGDYGKLVNEAIAEFRKLFPNKSIWDDGCYLSFGKVDSSESH